MNQFKGWTSATDGQAIAIRASLAPDLSVDAALPDHEETPPVDADQMYQRLAAIPDQIDAAERIVADVALQFSSRPRAVVLAGVGGSAAAADVVDAGLSRDLRVPVHVQRRATFPGWIGPGCLVVASSWSGNTVEAVRAAREAHAAGAQVVVVASGGELVEFAAQTGAPLLRTPGKMMPRLALTVMFAISATVLARAGVVDPELIHDELAHAKDLLNNAVRECRLSSPLATNPARQLASFLGDASPVVFAGGGLRSVARRFKEQLNENAKRWAAVEELPAAHHNALIAIGDGFRRGFRFVVLETQSTQALNDVVFNAVSDQTIRVSFASDARAADLLYASLVVDYTSLYAAYAANENPTPVGIVDRIKDALASDSAAVS